MTKLIKSDLTFLEKDAFLICGPEEMILGCIEALEFYGVAEDKIIYELFTSPVKLGDADGISVVNEGERLGAGVTIATSVVTSKIHLK